MTRISPAIGAPLQVLAIAVCAGRPFLGVHYPTDVLAGILLGRALGRHWPMPGVPGSRQKEVWTR